MPCNDIWAGTLVLLGWGSLHDGLHALCPAGSNIAVNEPLGGCMWPARLARHRSDFYHVLQA